MSLKGQWIARYSGSNNGTVVIELDEFEDHFAGTAVAWDDNTAHPNALVRIRTPSKSNTHHLDKVEIIPLDRWGSFLSQDGIKHIAASGIIMPATLDIDLRLDGDALSVGWTSSIGTSASAAASASKTRGGLSSDLKPTFVRGWEGFNRLRKNYTSEALFRSEAEF